MKKSKNITKYNMKWQIVRSRIKGNSVSLQDKIDQVNEYFNSENTIDAYERVLNYLEGLQLGYKGKNPEAVDIIEKEMEKYRDINTDSLSKEPDGFIKLSDTVKYSFEERLHLWKDLFNRNRKWMEKGYVQKEINDFMDIMHGIFDNNNEQLPDGYSYSKLLQLRKKAGNIENTHKFFF